MAKHPRSLVPAVGAAPPIEVALPRPRPAAPWRLTRFLESERLLAALLLAPAVVLLALFIAYPFVMGVWLALSDASVGSPGTFVGLRNFVMEWYDLIFQISFKTKFLFTFWASIFKMT